MLPFLVLSGLWLVAAGTAHVWYHSAPPGYVFASSDAFHVWFGIGISGAILTIVSVAQILCARGGFYIEGSSRHQRRLALARLALALCIGAAGELLLVLLVTRHAISTAPFGADSGEAAVPIAELGLAQVLFVGVLAALVSRILRFAPAHDRGSHWSGFLGPAGMALTCTAFALWSLQDGTRLIVNTTVIAGTPAMTNSGAWWPGLFAAMCALTIVAVVCAPGIGRRADGDGTPRLEAKEASATSNT